MRLTVKIGSNVLSGSGGLLDVERMGALVSQMARLRGEGHQIVLVSSGAMAAGRGMLTDYRDLGPVAQRQLLASVGQVKLIDTYKQLFDAHGTRVAQLLVTKQDLGTRSHYLNMKSCVETLWRSGVMPIVNENDAVSLTGLMFTDNDELSGLIASMMDCQALYILSNVPGIYDGDPSEPGTSVIREVAREASVAQYVRVTKSDFGRGGMQTKCRMAQKTARAGIDVFIAAGHERDVLVRLVNKDPTLQRTHFVASEHLPAVKKWIAYSDGFATARVVVNPCAEKVFTDHTRVASLLPVGVTDYEGDFKKDDIIIIAAPDGRTLGVGRAAMDKETALRQAQNARQKPLVHYDYLYIYPQDK